MHPQLPKLFYIDFDQKKHKATYFTFLSDAYRLFSVYSQETETANLNTNLNANSNHWNTCQDFNTEEDTTEITIGAYNILQKKNGSYWLTVGSETIPDYVLAQLETAETTNDWASELVRQTDIMRSVRLPSAF